MRKVSAVILLIVIVGGGVYFLWSWRGIKSKASSEATESSKTQKVEFVPDPNTKYLQVPERTTFGELMTEQGVDGVTSLDIYQQAKEAYDLALVKPGQRLDLTYDEQRSLVKLVYDIDDDRQLVVEKTGQSWTARLQPIVYQVSRQVAKGNIQSSLYEAALAAGLQEGLIIELAEAFGSAIDFSMDVQVGDSFKVLYEARERDGKPAKSGRVLAAIYDNAGQSYEIYFWTKADGKSAYYDEQGRAALKRFLRAPVAFKYISSGYTGNPRYVGGQYQRFTNNHLAIDYAAAAGTPIRAVADGRVVFAGWKSGYGNVVTLRHDQTYSTLYGHMSKILVKNGQAVSQSQTIGLVGSTGFSTGPHVHYEMIKNGIKINPLKEVQPPSEPLAAEELVDFEKQRQEYRLAWQ